MSQTVVITTEDLTPAVQLRAAFEELGFAVELLTASEDLGDVREDPVLVILSGGVREPRAAGVIASAHARGRVPTLGLLAPGELPNREVCRELGISECATKPIDIDEVTLVGRRLIQREELRGVTGIVGETEAMEEVLERVVQIAPVDSTVLIQGESGTGKELVARGIHALSRRRHRPFIAVNVAALPESLLESELFGHEKGAFTGAASLRKGLFELAHGGSIFLDEIGEMPLTTQTKLLRVLEERAFRRVGGEDELQVDVRVVAATNRELRDRVMGGEFRRDLYHRLNVLRIDLPALRERRADIPRLIERFIRHFSATHDRPFLGIDPEALRILVDYEWPGNVRELRNLVESMVVLAPGRVIRPEDIPPEVRGRRPPVVVPLIGHVAALGPADGNGNGHGEAAQPQQLEFIFRTLFDLKLDIEDLRRDFDAYRQRQVLQLPATAEAGRGYIPLGDLVERPGGADAAVEAPERERGSVVYRPGMTMQDLEREAISSALREASGNRRRAAEMLDIGERTLYRKIKEYGIEA